jgi:hypothetical protein
MHEELTDATEALTKAQRALTEAVSRVSETDAAIVAEDAKAHDAQRAFAEALEQGADGAKQQAFWAKARATLTALQERKEHLAAAIQRRQLDVARAQRGVAQAETRQFAGKAAGIGANVLVMLGDVVGEFHELEALDRANHAAHWAIKHADTQLGEQTPLAPSALFSSRLGEKLWDLLRDLDLAVREQQRRREIAKPVTMTSVA